MSMNRTWPISNFTSGDCSTRTYLCYQNLFELTSLFLFLAPIAEYALRLRWLQTVTFSPAFASRVKKPRRSGAFLVESYPRKEGIPRLFRNRHHRQRHGQDA